MQNEKAVAAFLVAVSELRGQLEVLKYFVDNHMDVAPEDVNWGDVGTARHLLELVREAEAFVNLKVEEGC